MRFYWAYITCSLLPLWLSAYGATLRHLDAVKYAERPLFLKKVVHKLADNNSGKIRPIIYMHGIFGKPNEHEFPTTYIQSKVPGAIIYPIKMFDGLESALNLYHQLKYIIPAMQTIMDNHTDTGVTLLCYSQGGVICRSVVQMLSTHNVHTMITLSSPLDGQYGVTSYMSSFVPNKDRKYLWEFWYSGVGQDISIGDYWNDPHHQREFSDPKTDVLIARLNNQTGHSDSAEYKRNFLKLQKLVMIGGPHDSVITPWQSAQLGFYNQNETVLPYEQQPWYIDDGFGLQTLDKAKKVVRHTIPVAVVKLQQMLENERKERKTSEDLLRKRIEDAYQRIATLEAAVQDEIEKSEEAEEEKEALERKLSKANWTIENNMTMHVTEIKKKEEDMGKLEKERERLGREIERLGRVIRLRMARVKRERKERAAERVGVNKGVGREGTACNDQGVGGEGPGYADKGVGGEGPSGVEIGVGGEGNECQERGTEPMGGRRRRWRRFFCMS